MATHDYPSRVPPQGGYVAKQCPVRVQWDFLKPGEPLPPSPSVERRIELGREFEASVVAKLLATHPSAVLISRLSNSAREAATLKAMEDGAELIIKGRLPSDPVARRVGEPDLLVRGGAALGYRPVDIKFHQTLMDDSGNRSALCSSLETLSWESAAEDPLCSARKSKDDLLQLAHYQRMLEAAGHAPPNARRGAIIGREEKLTWYDLDAPIWAPDLRRHGPGRLSTMDLYDIEFEFRLEVLASAAAHKADPSRPLLVEPVRISECKECPWWSWCGPILNAGSGHVSLVPGIGERASRVHREHGVNDRQQLASLNHRTAAFVAVGVDVRPLLAALDTLPDDTAIAEVIGTRKQAQLARLAEGGINSLSDARGLSVRTSAYIDEPLADLPEQIDLARAALGRAPVYRRRNVDYMTVPRGDLEVDVDMESAEAGVYLWGTLVTDRSGRSAVTTGYRPFCRWEPLTPDTEAALFRELWDWLQNLRAICNDRGLSFRAYCYNAGAENTQMRRIAAASPLDDSVSAFLSSGQWIDLLQVFRSQLLTGSSLGLKSVARLFEFTWDVEDASGGESMLRYEHAIGPGESKAMQEARDWLLTYNRNDVEATHGLREWMEHTARDAPSLDELGP